METTAQTKTVYLHDNGELVIWGRSQYFESSPLVRVSWRIPEEIADSKDFRAIVEKHNEYVRAVTHKMKSCENKITTYEKRGKMLRDLIGRVYDASTFTWPRFRGIGKSRRALKHIRKQTFNP